MAGTGTFVNREPSTGKEGHRRLTKISGDPDSVAIYKVEFADDATEEGTPYSAANIATDADMQAGADDEKLVTPKKVYDSYVNGNGWSPINETWAYASETTITVPSGAASRYQKGDKIKITQTTVKYFYVVAVSDTVLTVTGGDDYAIANAAITEKYYSNVENPHGFPSSFNYTSGVDAGSGAYSNATCMCKFKVIGDLVYLRAQVNIIENGTAGTYTRFLLPIACVDAAYPHIIVGREDLATGNLLYGQVYSAYCIVVKADGTYAGATGYAFGMNGFYLMA